MNNTDFIKVLQKIVNTKTIYVLGGIGQPLTASAKLALTQQYDYNRTNGRKYTIYACSEDTFAFDCVGLIKSVLWGFCFDETAYLGGAKYNSNGVPDIGADMMISKCNEISYDFSKITEGEAVWLDGHIGVYIGNGKVIECTPSWKDCVQVTDLTQRRWVKHGKLPYITYNKVTAATGAKTSKSVNTLAKEVISGKWGNGAERKQKLTAAGYDYTKVQNRVNELIHGASDEVIDKVARDVIAGKYGNGAVRKKSVAAAGYDYETVQKRVNEILNG